ncbi:la-related protein 7 [Zerene cesonia]|uniref:la-related protein 7 n=1 Tax=Zerene cesonia TaxID=33412 RepID=UPI0018E594DA|nr:la-related protein 7 [Zerene cesonia]
MSESENNDTVEQSSKHELIPKKRIRHRKKQLYENILKQMEFYFSDANLSKDRYLGDLVAADPYVPLTEFLKFNKLRSMTQEVSDIVKAMKYSTFLELSEDKLKVKRKTPMVPYDADLRTVYVESIPVTASRDWLERVFSDYGKVAYISLPKFKNSNKIKGFGFIEFARPQDAQKCIKAFTEMGCKLPTCMPPDELSSIKMFAAEEKDIEEVGVKEYEPPKKKSKKSKEKKVNKGLDLKLGSESDCERRIDTPTDEINASVPATPDVSTPDVETPTEESKSIEKECKDELTSHDESKTGDETPRKKKAKKRSLKEKGKKNNLDKGEAPKGALWGLQVLAKSEWKILRNKYLNLQRKYMKELKQNWQEKRKYTGIPAPAAPSVEVENASGVQEMDRTKSLLEKIPGVFVKESLPEPCLDVKLTKRTIRTNIHVQHVEVKEGQTEAVIRFNSAKAANEYCANSGNRARVLLGAEEDEQWTRAENALSAKRTRGRAKLLARTHALSSTPAIAPASPQPTHTHIRFDE